MSTPATLTRGLVLTLACALASTAAAKRVRPSQDLDAAGLPNVRSMAALVVDLASGDVLFERDADAVRPIASISKLVGALVIHEECKLDPEGLHEMSAQNRDAARGGDKTKLTTGWRFSHKDLMHAALMRSDNRALPALGEACGLTPAELGERMTARVRKIGLTQTSFKEPNGLSPENVSTPREVIQFLREVLKHPELSEILATPDYVLTARKGSQSRLIPIKSTDRLLARNIAKILGGKTGYTDLARYCFTVAARMSDHRELGMVFLGGEGKLTRFADFTRVVKWLYPDGGRPAAAPVVVTPVAAPLAPIASPTPTGGKPAGRVLRE